MTTTVGKGTNRPAAEARKAKAAQRTPLVKPVEKPLDELTISQLRSLARNRGLSTTTKLTRKAELLAALAKPIPTAPTTPRAMGSLAAEAAKAPDTGARKAEELSAFLAKYDWVLKVSKAGAAVKVTAKRGKEILVIQWLAGTYDYGASSYTRADGKTVKLLNVSAAKTRVSAPIEEES